MMHIFIKITNLIIRLTPSKLLTYFINSILRIRNYRKQVINLNYKSTIGAESNKETFDVFYKKCIANVSKILVETLKFNKPNASKLTYRGINELEKQCKENNGLILMASHYGNWELACINLPLHTTVPCYAVYKPLKNNAFDKEILRLRSRFGLNLIPMNSIARSISTNNKNGIPAIYILIADQNPRSISDVIWVKFLGKMSAFSGGLVKLQNKYKFSIAYMKTTPGSNYFQYNIEFEFPSKEESNDSLEWYSQRLENQIKTDPEYWLWSHKRWKRKYEEKKLK